MRLAFAVCLQTAVASLRRRLPTHFLAKVRWWSRTGSNRRPQACKASALPTELRPRRALVGLSRFELLTSPLSGVRSNQLSYRPPARSTCPQTGWGEEARTASRKRPAIIRIKAIRTCRSCLSKQTAGSFCRCQASTASCQSSLERR